MKTFNITILNPEQVIYKGTAVSVVVPAAKGSLGVLADHAPLVANLVSGVIEVKTASGEKKDWNYEGKGFLEVFQNQVSVLLASPLAMEEKKL